MTALRASDVGPDRPEGTEEIIAVLESVLRVSSSFALSEVWVQRSGLQCSSITADNIFTQIKKKLGNEI